MPAVRWDAFADHISSTIDAHEEQAAQAYRMPAWIRVAAMPLALAASLLIVAGVGFEIYRSQQSAPHGNPAVVASSSFVDLPTDKATGPAVELVAIGPTNSSSGQPTAIPSNDNDLSRSSHIAIASGIVPAHDTDSYSSFDMQ
jgi:hypothetical protein